MSPEAEGVSGFPSIETRTERSTAAGSAALRPAPALQVHGMPVEAYRSAGLSPSHCYSVVRVLELPQPCARRAAGTGGCKIGLLEVITVA